MALFSITRYGDDTEPTPTADKGNQILQRLHEAAERKRKSLSGDTADDTTQSPKKKKRKDDESPKKGKKEKSFKKSEIVSDTEQTPKKKQKKKRKDATDDEISSPTQDVKTKQNAKETELLEEDSPVKGKTKRKLKDKIIKDDIQSSSEDEKEDTEELEHGTSEEDEDVREDQDEDKGAGQSHEEVGGFTVIGDVLKQKTVKVQRKLPDWLAKPTVITDDIRNNRSPLEAVAGLDEDLRQTLRDNGVQDFFPVQTALLPALLRPKASGGFRPHDLCCSAPTGSGKTLAYVLPIVQSLRSRVVPQIRALIVLPVHDLVTQVYKVFSTYCRGTTLKVVQVIGRKALNSEQQTLVRKGPRGYHSNADILVCTPGRLVDHINTTPGFSLRHLQYLVIDEADRMMDEIKQDWLSHVERAVYSGDNQASSPGEEATKVYGEIYRKPPGPLTAYSTLKPAAYVQKLLFSATLSQNPEKLQALSLFQPRLFTSVVSQRSTQQGEPAGHQGELQEAALGKKGEFIGKYTTPAGLTEFYAESDAGSKPLLMLYFIRHLKFRNILCFTNSVEAAHRLYWLLKLSCDIEVREFSSKLQANRRSRILKQFADGKIDILICSDVMARGMDMDSVQYVISYDSPPYIKTYIHRVGRTARAGKAGTAISLLVKKEIYHFKKMLRDAGKADLKELKVKKSDLELYVEDYQGALQQMPDIIASENRR